MQGKPLHLCDSNRLSSPITLATCQRHDNIVFLTAKPSRISGISPSSITNTSFSLSWNPATPADFPIKDYKAVLNKAVLKKNADGSIVKTNYNLTSTTTTFNGLESFTEYIVEISAQSSLGAFSDVAKHEVKTDQGGTYDKSVMSGQRVMLLFYCHSFIQSTCMVYIITRLSTRGTTNMMFSCTLLCTWGPGCLLPVSLLILFRKSTVIFELS